MKVPSRKSHFFLSSIASLCSPVFDFPPLRLRHSYSSLVNSILKHFPDPLLKLGLLPNSSIIWLCQKKRCLLKTKVVVEIIQYQCYWLLQFFSTIYLIISHKKMSFNKITFMYCNRLHAWWSTQSWLGTLLSCLIACQWVGNQPAHSSLSK